MMLAKFDSVCHLCNSPIYAGQEITRDNNERSHRSYVHADCNPTAGRIRRAGYRVTITKANPRDFTVGESRQFVYESKANEVAEWLRRLGCEVETTLLANGVAL